MADIVALKNVEQRAVVISEYGLENLLDALHPKTLDTWNQKIKHPSIKFECAHCTLIEFDMSTNPERPSRVRALCLQDHSTLKKTVHIVPSMINTVLAGLAWQFDMTEAAYLDSCEMES
jgi:hypothetical protein